MPDELNAVLIAYCAGDGEIDLSAVTEVTGRFKVWQCTPLAHLSMPFESVGGNLVFDETGLVEIDAPTLESMGGSPQIVDNPDLSDISDLMGLVEGGGDVTISGNLNLAAEDVAALIEAIDAIGGTVTVKDNG
ncbi:MAG: hypothetical protein GY913_22440 [Proteobacteria bacterium]|nr:hypothetical protein [Pseudomonadota bacterium]MCP4919669.1 hypothetical protein [Pseudomonadota bacterium]